MRTRWSRLVTLMFVLAPFIGCSDDITAPEQQAFEAMLAAGTTLINDNAQTPGVLSAQLVKDNLDDYTIIDIRKEADYVKGHIAGASHSTLGTLIADLESGDIPTGKPYVIVCYTGQSAGHAKVAMELLGYGDVYSLKFGMAAWNPVGAGKWDANVGDQLGSPETADNNDGLTEQNFPVLTGHASTVVRRRVEEMLERGFKAKSFDNIRDNLDDYFIINYFEAVDYLGQGTSGVPGHIPGAFQFTPYASLDADAMLKYLPTDMPIIVYCWTGQHSSQVVAILNMLGYEAYSLTFGVNGLFHSQLTAHKWSAAAKFDFAYETGYLPTPVFEELASTLADYMNDGTDAPGVLSAVALHDNLADYTVIDFRGKTDYDAGHIPGAYHTSLTTMLDDVGTTIPTDKPFVVVCYTGQTAGHSKLALELMGYEDTYSLKFGMAAWNSSLAGSWNNNTDDKLGSPETTSNNGDLVIYEYPSLTGYTVNTVVEERLEEVLAAGFKAKSFDDIRDNLNEYFVINYFGEADYLGTGTSGVPGHIPGAFQFTPYASLGRGEMLAYLPTDKPIIVYCWTGQHSSQVTMYLNMLGYEAYSLKFGSNQLFHSQLTGHKWTAGAMNDFTLETTTAPALMH